MKGVPFGFVGDSSGTLLVAASARVSSGDLIDGWTFGAPVSTGGRLGGFDPLSLTG